MDRRLFRWVRGFVLYATTQHIVWAVAILIDSQSMNATAVSALKSFTVHGAVIFLFVAAMMAASAHLVVSSAWRVVMLLPQQWLLFLSAATAIQAMWHSHFADGVLRPTAFIVVDQLPACLLAIAHVCAASKIILDGRASK